MVRKNINMKRAFFGLDPDEIKQALAKTGLDLETGGKVRTTTTHENQMFVADYRSSLDFSPSYTTEEREDELKLKVKAHYDKTPEGVPAVDLMMFVRKNGLADVVGSPAGRENLGVLKSYANELIDTVVTSLAVALEWLAPERRYRCGSVLRSP